MVYEFIDHSHRIDENVLVVDFRFDSDVSQEQAIKIIDKIISYADNDNTTASMTGYSPTIYATSPFKKE